MDFSFKKKERLKSRKLIGTLFRAGASVGAFPLRAVFLPLLFENPSFPVQISISVPKKNFKLAVDRNRIRRQIREAYRLQKPLFYEKLAPTDRRLAIMIIYTAKEALPYEEIEKGIRKMSRKILETPETSVPK
jgi:ribonuclease P protein component